MCVLLSRTCCRGVLLLCAFLFYNFTWRTSIISVEPTENFVQLQFFFLSPAHFFRCCSAVVLRFTCLRILPTSLLLLHRITAKSYSKTIYEIRISFTTCCRIRAHKNKKWSRPSNRNKNAAEKIHHNNGNKLDDLEKSELGDFNSTTVMGKKRRNSFRLGIAGSRLIIVWLVNAAGRPECHVSGVRFARMGDCSAYHCGSHLLSAITDYRQHFRIFVVIDLVPPSSWPAGYRHRCKISAVCTAHCLNVRLIKINSIGRYQSRLNRLLYIS